MLRGVSTLDPRPGEPPTATRAPAPAGRGLPLAQPPRDLASVELEFRRQMGDDVLHEHAGEGI